MRQRKKYLLFDFLSSGFHMSFNFLGNLRLAFSASAEWTYLLVCVTHSTWQCNATDIESSCLQDVQLACRNSRKQSACCDLRAAISIYHKLSDNRIVFTWYTCSLTFYYSLLVTDHENIISYSPKFWLLIDCSFYFSINSF